MLIESEAEDLRSIGRARSYGASVALLQHGNDPGPVIVLLGGRVKVAAPSSAGRDVIVAVRGPGDLLGEMSAIDGEPRRRFGNSYRYAQGRKTSGCDRRSRTKVRCRVQFYAGDDGWKGKDEHLVQP